MATSYIDLERVIGLVQGDLLSISALTTIADVQRQSEPAGDGVTLPAVSIMGFSELSFPLRTGAASGGDAGADECAGTLQIAVQHTIDDYTTSRYAAESVLSVLRKSLEGRIVQDATAAVPSLGAGSAQTGHYIRYCAGTPRPFRAENGSGPGDEEGQSIRVYVAHIDCVIRRVGSGLLSED